MNKKIIKMEQQQEIDQKITSEIDEKMLSDPFVISKKDIVSKKQKSIYEINPQVK